MLYSYEWLKQFVPRLPSPEVVAEQLTLHAVEVEGVRHATVDLGHVVVAEVLDVRKHPNADSLHIGHFNVGESQPRQIVFGGKAVLKKGMRIPVALAPTTISGGVKIVERKLRGELSQGMCCLHSELGILDKKEVVHQFDRSVAPGTLVADALGLGGVVLEIENVSMTQRADLFSHQYMAAEIAAVLGLRIVLPRGESLPLRLPRFPVVIQDKKACRRYMAIECTVLVSAAPSYIVQRLNACGIKSINGVVDITNYVMLELGQPMHVFDAEKLHGGISVRRAQKGERIRTLDHETKTLTPDMLVIADDRGPIALAGVIGGEATGVTIQTKRVVIEVANFEPLITRRASQLVGVRTESVLRFEKGLSPQLVASAAQRVVALLKEHANAEIVRVTDVGIGLEHVQPIVLEHTTVERLSGIPWKTSTVKSLLKHIGCNSRIRGRKHHEQYVVTPPWYRRDLRLPEDLIEELIRLYGVQLIPEQQLQGVLRVGEQQSEVHMVRQMKELLVRAGAMEVQHYPLYGAALAAVSGFDVTVVPHVELQNPLSDDLRYLRVSLLPRLFATAAQHQRHREQGTLFEVGHLFSAEREAQYLGILMYGVDDAYRRVRGLLEYVLRDYAGVQARSQSGKTDGDVGLRIPGTSLMIALEKQQLGVVGTVDPPIAHACALQGTVAVALLSLSDLVCHQPLPRQMTPISEYPPVPLDVSVIVDESVSWSDIEQVVRAHGGQLLQRLDVFDVYRGTGMPKGKKSISFHMVFQSPEKTLVMHEMEQWRDQLVQRLSTTVGAVLRYQ